jgi:Cytochrome domain of cellobiose dehydrogenase
MRWALGVTWAAAVLGIGLPMYPSHETSLTQLPASHVQAADSKVVKDAETGFTFAQYAASYIIGSSILYRIALPQPVNSTNYDIVLQIVAPKDVGWAGIAWGGEMVLCPLTVAWANGNNVVLSSRYAT